MKMVSMKLKRGDTAQVIMSQGMTIQLWGEGGMVFSQKEKGRQGTSNHVLASYQVSNYFLKYICSSCREKLYMNTVL